MGMGLPEAILVGSAPPMSVAQLEYFVAVAEEEHLCRAASRLHISQPPLSRQIRALEEEVGEPLFERTSRGMRLLPRGRLFLEEARDVLRHFHRLQNWKTREVARPQERTGGDEHSSSCLSAVEKTAFWL